MGSLSRAFFDSHVAYWLASGGREIHHSVVAAINTHSSRVVSALTFAELEIKNIRKRRIDLDALRLRFADMYISIEPFHDNASSEISRFPALDGHDPFDRMILAQAASRPNTTFYTADQKLLELGLDWVYDARG